MMNTSLSYFILGAYLPLGNLRVLVLTLTACLYVLVLFLNGFLVAVICWNRTLHEPPQLFLFSLFLNEVYGGTGLCAFLLDQLRRDVHVVSVPFCFLQVFCFYTYANVELFNLTVMSYDRYVAICRPLEYKTVMTLSRAALLVVLVWIYSFARCLITIALNLRLTLCGNFIDNLFCHNYLIVRLACSDTQLNNFYGFGAITLSVLVPLVPILFSYGQILRVVLSRSSPGRGRKAAQTCAPHIVSLLNFSLGSFFEILQTRFDASAVPVPLRVALPLYFSVLQLLLSPVMYGVRTSAIRRACKDALRNLVRTLDYKTF